MINVEVQAQNTLLLFKQLPDALSSQLRIGIMRAVKVLRTEIDGNLAKGTFGIKTKSGRLRMSLQTAVFDIGKNIVGVVGSNLKYARIQEEGGRTKPHIIEARKAKSLKIELSFMSGKGIVFLKKVNHPGSNIPPHWYMRKTAEAEKTRIGEIIMKSIGQTKGIV